MDAIQSYIFHQEMDIARLLVMPANNEEAKLIKQAEIIYAHKYWLFSLAGGMDVVIEKVKEAYESWEIHHQAKDMSVNKA